MRARRTDWSLCVVWLAFLAWAIVLDWPVLWVAFFAFAAGERWGVSWYRP